MGTLELTWEKITATRTDQNEDFLIFRKKADSLLS